MVRREGGATVGMRRILITTGLAALVLVGCEFGPRMYSRAIAVSKFGPDDIERLDTATRSGKGIFGPPHSTVFLRTRASAHETVGVYLKRFRAEGWTERQLKHGSRECWHCTPECRQGKECYLVFDHPNVEGQVSVNVFGEVNWDIHWPEAFKARYDPVAKDYTWVVVSYSPVPG
jgi:hypothetical protein